MNRLLVLEMVRQHRPVSRAEVSKLTGMSATAIGRIVGDLIDGGLVRETDQYSTGVGRRATMLDIDVHSIMSAGIEIDRNRLKIGLVDLDGRIAAQRELELGRSNSRPEAIVETIASAVRKLADEHGIDASKLIGVGVGMPGVMNPEEGTAVFSAQLGWSNVSFAPALREKIGLPVVLDNDLKVKALGESGTASISGDSKTALISIGSGVGSAIVIDGKIFRGANNIAGEIGHSTIDPNGKLCECGKRGCLQTYITDLALLQEAGQIKPVGSVEELYRLMQGGETWAFNIIDRACTYIAITINNVVCTYNPDTIVMAGSFIDIDPDILERVKGKLKEFIWEPFVGTFKLTRSQLGEQAIMIGAAKLALQRYLGNGLQQQ
ncbi:ROK family transcriptional regulator [Paenibacillus sp. MWE-103]|uniref:ROK family transcriptional regulator n=1 Tax=Paenibacillus artemisiicola TaxID=1172618 RepID=A0ABS3W4M0_9BACL|nr:ROK family transcriptional regulator [Paenibacillus artemisiicola]MBO7743258.1 ROK family transcriptional regulator [Paenibacillus artemisiicola]